MGFVVRTDPTDLCVIEGVFWSQAIMIAWPGRIMIRPAEPRMRGSDHRGELYSKNLNGFAPPEATVFHVARSEAALEPGDLCSSTPPATSEKSRQPRQRGRIFDRNEVRLRGSRNHAPERAKLTSLALGDVQFIVQTRSVEYRAHAGAHPSVADELTRQ